MLHSFFVIFPPKFISFFLVPILHPFRSLIPPNNICTSPQPFTSATQSLLSFQPLSPPINSSEVNPSPLSYRSPTQSFYYSLFLFVKEELHSPSIIISSTRQTFCLYFIFFALFLNISSPSILSPISAIIYRTQQPFASHLMLSY